MTEEFYNSVAVLYDDIAERVLQLGSKPPATVKEYLENASIKEETQTTFVAHEVINGLIHDFGLLRVEYYDILQMAENSDDVATANIAADQIQWLEKSIWLLKSSL